MPALTQLRLRCCACVDKPWWACLHVTGATSTNQLVDVGQFFVQHILPELQSPNVSERPILKADALKFLTTFRSQIPKEVCVQVSF